MPRGVKVTREDVLARTKAALDKDPALTLMECAAVTRSSHTTMLRHFGTWDELRIACGHPRPEAAPTGPGASRQLVNAKNRTMQRELEELRAQIKERAEIQKPVKPARIVAPKRGETHEACPIVGFSDWHVEEPVDPLTVSGLNEYNLEIAEERATRAFQRALKLVNLHRKSVKIREMVLWVGGDFISNTIHDELDEKNLLRPVPAARFAKRLLLGGIDFLLRQGDFERIRIVGSFGNHGRSTDKTRISTAGENSYEVGIYRDLEDHYARTGEKRAEFQIASGHIEYVNIYDRWIRFTHGDAVRYQGGIGGPSVAANKKIERGWDREREALITIMGHHHMLMLDAGLFCLNGSLIGYSPYSRWIGARQEDPQQLFLLMDSKFQAITARHAIWVKDA